MPKPLTTSSKPRVFEGVRLFTLVGIPVYARPSLLIVLVMLVVILGFHFFPTQHEDTGYRPLVYILMGVAGALLFFLSVLLHEIAHCLLARSEMGGRIAIRRITLFFLGGLSEMTEEPRTAAGEFVISFSGPLASIMLGALMWPGAILLKGIGVPVFITGVLSYIGYLNIFLGVTNLLPGFPLDGGRVLRAIIWRASGSFLKATTISATAGRVLGYGMLGAGLILTFASEGSFIVQAVFLVMIGLFIERSARQALAFARAKAALEGLRASDAMQISVPCVWEETTLAEAVNNCMIPHRTEAVVVLDEAEQLRGILRASMLENVPRHTWQVVKVGDLFEHDTLPAFARPDEPLPSIYTLMMRHTLTALPVLDPQGKVLGVVTLRDLYRIATLRAHAY